jgi:hypothetical protein
VYKTILVSLFALLLGNFASADDLSDFLNAGHSSAIQLPPEKWGKTHADFFKFLDKQIEGKRVVFLGEAAHWVSEKYDYRLILLNYLVGKGFRNIGMEMGLSDGARVDRFLQTGDASQLNRVALYGYHGSFVRDRLSAKSCGDEDKTNPEFAHRFGIEEKKFYSSLYQIGVDNGLKGKVRHFGFDIDTVPGGGYEDIQQILGSRKSSSIIAIRKALKLVQNENLDEEATRLGNALKLVDSHKNQLVIELGPVQFAKLRAHLATLSSSFKFLAVFAAKPCDPAQLAEWTKTLLVAMAEREKVMFENFETKLQQLGPDEKIVLMGHNFHLSKDPASLWFTSAVVPVTYAPSMWPSIGQFVSRDLSMPTFSIWMIHNRGTQSNINCPTVSCLVESKPGYLGQTLSNLGPVFALPLFAMPTDKLIYLNQRLNFGVNGGTYSGNVVRNTDMIFFVNDVTGLREGALQ